MHKLHDTTFDIWKKRDDFTDADLGRLEYARRDYVRRRSMWMKASGADLYPSGYEHYLMAGHAQFYATKLRNLRRYSQEACEAFIGLMQNFFFYGTNHGGGRSGHHGDRDGSSVSRAFLFFFLRRLQYGRCAGRAR